MKRNRVVIAVLSGVTCALVAARPVSAACGPDLDADGMVGVSDMLQLLAAWGSCHDCAEDLDGDGLVGITDFLTLLSAWGPAVFNYGPPLPDAEAEQIGLEMLGAAGPLLVPGQIYARVDADLDAIRAFEPALVGQTHAGAWVPNDLIVGLIPEQPDDEYVCLNSYYQVIEEDNLFGDVWVLTYARNLNIPALVVIYEQAPNVSYAEANGLIGGQNFWTPTDLGGGTWRWIIDDGWHDCFDGCDCHRVYTFETDSDGNVTMINFQEFGQPWCDFGE